MKFTIKELEEIERITKEKGLVLKAKIDALGAYDILTEEAITIEGILIKLNSLITGNNETKNI